MKKKLSLNILREVIKSKSRFISIFLIIALGSGFFAGLKATSPNMVKSVETYYEESNLMDFNIKTSTLFIEGDIEKYRIDEIEDIELKNEFIAKVLNIKNELDNVLVTTYNPDAKINKLDLVKGRFPTEDNEIVIESNSNSDIVYNIGEEITLKTDYLKNKTFTVVGIVRSPLYITNNRNINNDSRSSNLFVAVLESNMLVPGYTDIYLTVKDKYNPYSDEYKNHINSLKDKISNINQPSSYIFTRFDIQGYKSFYDDALKVDIVSTVIPIFFAFIALLVSLTTIMRMVDEQRIEIGTLFSLGYSKKDIWLKYFVYAMVPTICGTIIGVISATLILPPIIFNAYKMTYIIPNIILVFKWDYLLIAIGVATFCTTLSTTFSLLKLLKEPPANLLRPKNMKSGNKILLEYFGLLWNRFSFNWKMTLRNLFRFKRRTLITILGIAGCSGLMLTCLGINSSINKLNDKQEELSIYDGLVVFKDEESVKKLDNLELDYIRVNQFLVKIEGDDTDINMIVFDGEIDPFIKLRNSKTKTDYVLNRDDIIISEGVAKKLELNIGEEITVIDNQNKEYKIKITKITENYIYNYIYISKDNYEVLFGDINLNMALFNTNYLKDTKDQLLNDDDVMLLNIREDNSKVISNSLSNMSFIVAIMIFSSAILGIVVLYNLSNINITERAKELCTFKVMGFTNLEVNNYINRENYICTFFGIILGIVIGKYFEEYILGIIKSNNIYFIRDFNIYSFLLGIALTIVFTVLVNILLYFKIKRLNMVDAMKSVE